MYSTISQVRIRNHVVLTVSAVSDAQITEYINFVDGVIDGYLGGRYSVPFTPVPSLINGLSADMAASKALSQQIGRRGTDDEPTQAQELWDMSIELLKDLVDGKISIQAVGSAEVVQSGGFRSTKYGVTSKFGAWDPDDKTTFQE